MNSCDEIVGNRSILQRYVQKYKTSQDSLLKYCQAVEQRVRQDHGLLPKREIRRHVVGVLMFALLQLSIDLFGLPQLEAFVNFAGGATNVIKTEYVKILPLDYDACCYISPKETSDVFQVIPIRWMVV